MRWLKKFFMKNKPLVILDEGFCSCDGDGFYLNSICDRCHKPLECLIGVHPPHFSTKNEKED